MTTVPLSGGEPDDPTGSVTAWINDLKGGDRDAAIRLWSRYFRPMVQYSRSRLWGAERLAADEEDVALSAFESFCRGAENGRFPTLHGRDEFWRLLAHLMTRKAADQVAHERCQKRGGLAVRQDGEVLDTLESADAPPDLCAQMAEEFQRLLDRLPDPGLRAIAVMKLEGHTNEEVGRRLDCTERTVARKLMLVRRWWSEDSA